MNDYPIYPQISPELEGKKLQLAQDQAVLQALMQRQFGRGNGTIEPPQSYGKFILPPASGMTRGVNRLADFLQQMNLKNKIKQQQSDLNQGMTNLKQRQAEVIRQGLADPKQLLNLAIQSGNPALMQLASGLMKPAPGPKGSDYQLVQTPEGWVRVPKVGGAAEPVTMAGGGQAQIPPKTPAAIVNVGDKAKTVLNSELAKYGVKSMGEAMTKLGVAAQAKEAALRMEALNNNDKLLKGPLTSVGTFLGQLLEGAGFQLSPKQKEILANTEEFSSHSAEQWLKMMGLAGGAKYLTDKETAEIWKIVATTKNTTEGRKALINAVKTRADKAFKRASAMASAMKKAVRSKDPVTMFDELIDSQLAGYGDVFPNAGGASQPTSTSNPAPTNQPDFSNVTVEGW